MFSAPPPSRFLLSSFACAVLMQTPLVFANQETPAQSESTAPASDEVSAAASLRWHWQPGKSYALQTETETSMSLEPLGRSGEQVLQVIQNTRVEVRAAKTPGTKELVVHFDSLRGRLAVEGKTFLYDSEDRATSHPALSQMLADSSGRSFSLIYTEDDRFSSVGSIDQPAAKPGEAPSLLAVADAREVAALFRRSLEMALPRPEVAPGDKWTSIENIAFPQAGNMEVKMNCHYAEQVRREQRPHARIVFQGNIGQAPALLPEQSAPAGVSLGRGSSLSGQIFFDLERRAISISVFNGDLIIVREGQEFPVRQSVTTRLLSISVNPS